jgi:hypothetical protein
LLTAKIFQILAVLVLISGNLSPLQAQVTQEIRDTSVLVPADNWDFFDRHEPLRLTLASDFTKLKRNKYETKYQPAELTIHLAEGDSATYKIRIRPRGNRRLDLCGFPPIKLNFKKSDRDNPHIGDETTMKLVTHCNELSSYDDWILKEYLVYRMFNVLTDFSFKVRLVEMKYIDTGKNEKLLSKHAFLIEHIKRLAERHDGMEIEELRISQKTVNQKQLAIMGLFQFMIGNTDWAVSNEHNLKYIRRFDVMKPEPITIPYDFDYSGIVDTDYATPTLNLPIDHVRQRYYLLWCMPEEIMNETFELYLEKKGEIYAVIQDFPYLKGRSKKLMIKYLDDFFQIIESEKKRKSVILNRCIPG